MKHTAKTILFAGNLVGGLHKSTTVGAIADSLHKLGYSTKLIAFDCYSKSTLIKICPETTRYDPRDPEAYYQALTEAATTDADIAIIDCPDCNATSLFQAAQAVAGEGVRFVVGIITREGDERATEGGSLFVIDAAKRLSADYLLITIKATQTEEKAQTTENEKLLAKFVDSKVIEIPAFTQLMRLRFNDNPAVPSKFIASNSMEQVFWDKQHEQITQSVAKVAEWLTGKPASNH